jgi:mono/diheme cytochrome c family protein
MRVRISGFILLVLFIFTTACGRENRGPFEEPMALGGYHVEPTELNLGYQGYMLYCYACHGEAGDGKGPAAHFLRPPPRDFRNATYKFAHVIDGLPHDEDLVDIIHKGLKGSGMHPWDVPEITSYRIVQYIKTFSPDGRAWRSVDEETQEYLSPEELLGQRVLTTRDCSEVEEEELRELCLEKNPYLVEGQDLRSYGVQAWSDEYEAKVEANRREAIEHGERVYHENGCFSCHPGYASREKINAYRNKPGASFRETLYYSETKPSSTYTVSIMDGKRCRTDEQCEDGWSCLQRVCQQNCRNATDCGDPDRQQCVFGTCELKLKIKPPDFLVDEIRAGSTVDEIYRTIASGIPGSGMPEWRGAVHDRDIWAVSYYVNYLHSLMGKAPGYDGSYDLLSPPKTSKAAKSKVANH